MSFKRSTGHLENYEQHYTKIDECTASGHIAFEKEYDAASEYGLTNVGDPAEWDRLVSRMADSTDNGTFNTYWQHYHGRGTIFFVNAIAFL